MAEQNPINFTPTATGIGQGAAQVVNAQIKDLDYGAIQRAASAIGTAAAQVAQGAKRTREKNELIKRQYDAKVADAGGLKFTQTQEASKVLLDKMNTELLEAGTQAEKEAIYNKYIPELKLIKEEDVLYQRRIEAIGQDDRNTLFSNTADGTVIGVMDIVDELNSPLTEEQRNSLIADGAGQFVTGLDSYHNNIFKYAGTPETVGLEEVGKVLKAMEINQTIPVETDTEGKIDVYKTFEKLDADQRAIVENALLNPNSAFSQSYRNDQSIRQGTIDIPTTLDETTGFDIYDGQRDLLNNIIQSQMAVETTIYKKGKQDGEGETAGDASTGTEIENTIQAQPTQAFLWGSADGEQQYKSLPMVNTAEGFKVEGSDGKEYTISGFAYDSENDIKYAVTPEGRVIAPDNPDISSSLAETWESNFKAKKPENKQYLAASFNIIKDIEGTTLPESEERVTEFNEQLDLFGKGIDDEEALYDFLADITDSTSEDIKQARIAGPASKTFDQRFGGPMGGEDISSEQSKKAIENWVRSVTPTYFAPDVYVEQKKKIDAFYNPTNTTEEAKAEESNKGGATGNSLELDLFPTGENTNSAEAPVETTPTNAPQTPVTETPQAVEQPPFQYSTEIKTGPSGTKKTLSKDQQKKFDEVIAEDDFTEANMMFENNFGRVTDGKLVRTPQKMDVLKRYFYGDKIMGLKKDDYYKGTNKEKVGTAAIFPDADQETPQYEMLAMFNMNTSLHPKVLAGIASGKIKRSERRKYYKDFDNEKLNGIKIEDIDPQTLLNEMDNVYRNLYDLSEDSEAGYLPEQYASYRKRIEWLANRYRLETPPL